MAYREPPPDRTRVLPTVPPEGPADRRWTAGRPRRRRRWGRRVLLLLLALVVLLPVALLALLWVRVEKVDALSGGSAEARSAGTVYLLVGSDSRQGLTREEQRRLRTGFDESSRRTDTILLLAVPDGGGRPALVSIPRDSLVEIPGRGEERVNAAFAYGGPALLVETLEGATGVEIDEYVEIGFGGFVGVVDVLGTVQVCLDEPLTDQITNLDLPAGCSDLSPEQALGYVRARKEDPRGDLGRVERQRQFLSAVSDRVTSPAVLLNPWRLGRLAWESGDALVIDETTNPVDFARFALAMRAVSGDGGDRITVPVADAGNTVSWDHDAAEQLWQALREGREVPRQLVTE